jgi:SAM-dependent methyltransferase
MYNDLSADYDRFVNWQSRLKYELPFLQGELVNPTVHPHILDAACGTGMHAIALAQLGYQAVGADLSPGMVERARQNAALQHLEITFHAAGFGQLASTFHSEPCFPFDAILCLGNSLPHLLTPAALEAALADFAACLRPGGILVLQNRNFDAVMAQVSRWMEPQSHREDDHEWIFLRFYDFEPSGLITFNILTLKRQAQQPWQQHNTSSQLYPLRHDELIQQLEKAGFKQIRAYGNLAGDPFKKSESGNLVITAHLG